MNPTPVRSTSFLPKNAVSIALFTVVLIGILALPAFAQEAAAPAAAAAPAETSKTLYQQLMAGLRSAIAEGRLSDFANRFRADYASKAF